MKDRVVGLLNIAGCVSRHIPVVSLLP